jgi:hypothetical protein
MASFLTDDMNDQSSNRDSRRSLSIGRTIGILVSTTLAAVGFGAGIYECWVAWDRNDWSYAVLAAGFIFAGVFASNTLRLRL